MTYNSTDIFSKKIYLGCLILFAAVLFALTFYAGNFSCSQDQTVYQYIGKVVSEGQVVYRDVFDHKGPVTYFWYALGSVISTLWGVWLLNFILLIEILLLTFKLLLRFTKPWIALGIIVFVFSSLNYIHGIGNTETLSLLPLTLFLDIFCAYMQKRTLNKKDGILLGICLALPLLIKPTHLIIPATLGLYALFVGYKRRDINTLKQISLPALLTFTTIMSSVLFYFAYHHALSDFWDSYILFNLSYAKQQATWQRQLQAVRSFFVQPVFIVPFIGLFIFIFKKPPKILLPVFLTFIATFLVTIAPGWWEEFFRHYLIIIFPLSCLLLAIEINVINRKRQFFFLALLSILFIYNSSELFHNHYGKTSASQEHFSIILKQEIPPDTPFLDLTYSQGRLFLLSDRNSYSKYPFRWGIRKRIAQDLETKGPPLYITLQKDSQSILSYFKLPPYNVVYEDPRSLYILLKRKDDTQ
ncbi:MAG: hypothetical protein IKS41_04480 [Alphaproteobacteria bacterium]|nr:hypothetical protein [Alphaproteobacteria bacterium]